jgi:hypothetical protein
MHIGEESIIFNNIKLLNMSFFISYAYDIAFPNENEVIFHLVARSANTGKYTKCPAVFVPT